MLPVDLDAFRCGDKTNAAIERDGGRKRKGWREDVRVRLTERKEEKRTLTIVERVG